MNKLLQDRIIGNLSKDVFERRTSTGSEAFSLLICLDANKFVLLSFFSLIKTIYPRVSTDPLPNDTKSPFPVDVRRSKTLLQGENAQGAFHSIKTSGLNFWQLPVAHGTELSKISKKNRGKPREVYRNFRIFFPEVLNFFPFKFAPAISRFFGWMVRISDTQQLSEFLETFPGNFCTIYHRYLQIFESFGSMESAPKSSPWDMWILP